MTEHSPLDTREGEADTSVSVLFVCLGNICRSPTAQAVFERLLQQQGMANLVSVDSAGTAAYHIGKSPDRRALEAAGRRGYQLEHLRARQACVQDFYQFDYILAMDSYNFQELQQLAPLDARSRLHLFLEYAAAVDPDYEGPDEVPDPYYGGAEGFEQVLNLVEMASAGLLADIRQRLER